MKILKILLQALLVVASVFVTSSEGRRRHHTKAVNATVKDSSVPNECTEVRDGVCHQSCVAGGCRMECFDEGHYHSCEQTCVGKFPDAFL